MYHSHHYTSRLLVSALSLVSLVSMASGCATLSDSLLLEASTGAAVGGTTGYLATTHSTSGTLIGAGVGAAVGGAVAYFIHKRNDNKASAATPGKPEGVPENLFLTRPRVRMMMVPDKIDGDRFEEKHRVFIIEKNSTWGESND